MLAPFTPATCEEIFAELGTDKCALDTIGTLEQFCGIEAGKSVCDSKVLFARVDEAKKLAELEEKRKAKFAPVAEEPKIEKPEGLALIGIEDFMKVELRTAQIIECEPVPKAKKLLKLQVDLGFERRQVVSGIAKFYTPDQLIGKKVVLVSNLKPAKLCGVESYGMLLASGEEEVRVVFLDPAAKNGERIH
jgi:methionyl-tRNA synthetase